MNNGIVTEIRYTPIGVIHSPFAEPAGVPIQGAVENKVDAVAEVFSEFAEGLTDLDGFSHAILIYHFHKSKKYKLKVVPYLDKVKRGVFATRAPSRPNSIGLTVVQILKIEKNKIYFRNADMIEGTPLLDIKPYIPDVDIQQVRRIGWLEGKVYRMETTQDDSRFQAKENDGMMEE